MCFDLVDRGLKGIPDQVQVEKSDFLDSLYQDEDSECRFKSLRYNTKHNGVIFQENKKRTVNAVYVKYRVGENRITCKPYHESFDLPV